MPAPPEPPESIVLGQFRGIKNTVSRERLAPDELEHARNIDIDDAGQVRRRRGYALKDAANYHSLQTIGGRALVVRNNILGVLNPDYTFVSLGVTAGSARVSYTQVDQTTFFSSTAASGKLLGTAVSPWGVSADGGRWVSPVLTPTATLGEVFGQRVTAPPYAEHVVSYSGRIYLAAGKYLWATELYMYDYIDPTKNFLQFEDDITVLAAVSDGLYVGTERGLYFLRGSLSQGFRQDRVVDVPVIRGSDVMVPSTNVHPSAQQGAMPEGMAMVCMTAKGVFACFAGGQAFDITRGRVVFPASDSAAALYREDSGGTSYLAVTDSAGGPQANARIGDFADAEIVRFQGG